MFGIHYCQWHGYKIYLTDLYFLTDLGRTFDIKCTVIGPGRVNILALHLEAWVQIQFKSQVKMCVVISKAKHICLCGTKPLHNLAHMCLIEHFCSEGQNQNSWNVTGQFCGALIGAHGEMSLPVFAINGCCSSSSLIHYSSQITNL